MVTPGNPLRRNTLTPNATRQQRLDAMTPSQRQGVYPSKLDQFLSGKKTTENRVPSAETPVNETSSDLTRMQNLAGIRKN
jgi:hypothetical protein